MQRQPSSLLSTTWRRNRNYTKLRVSCNFWRKNHFKLPNVYIHNDINVRQFKGVLPWKISHTEIDRETDESPRRISCQFRRYVATIPRKVAELPPRAAQESRTMSWAAITRITCQVRMTSTLYGIEPYTCLGHEISRGLPVRRRVSLSTDACIGCWHYMHAVSSIFHR